ARLRALWSRAARASFYEHFPAHLHGAVALPCSRAIYRRALPERLRRRSVRNSSSAGGISRVDCRAQRRAQRRLFHADANRLRGLRRSADRGSVSRRDGRLRTWSFVQTNARDIAVGLASARLLAAWTHVQPETY